MQALPSEDPDRRSGSVPSLPTTWTNRVTLQNPLAGPRRFWTVAQTIRRRLGVDRAIAYTLIGRGWSLIAGPVTIVLIARFLGPEEQGFYYTFGSVIALNIFFELGLTYVLLQFASHEKAYLEWTTGGTLSGSEVAELRLAALLKLAMRWYGVAAVLVLLLVLPAGLLFFSQNSLNSLIAWQTAWIWLVTVSALNLLVAPLFAILEGCDKISQIASMRVSQSVLSSLGLWLTLLCHGGLFASPVFQTLNLTFGLVWLLSRYRRFFRSLLQTDVTRAPFHWRTEVWPFQWRIALSWLSGYFIFHLFNPVLFASHGPVVAGQMGMSLTLCGALGGASMAWMSTKASRFGVLVATRQWQALDTLFLKALRQSLVVLVVSSVVIYVCISLLNYIDHPISRRVLNPIPFALLLLAAMMNHVVFCEAQYLRTHKAEPFLWPSIAIGTLMTASTFLLAKSFGAFGVSAGYLMCSAVGLLLGTKIFFEKRREWHV